MSLLNDASLVLIPSGYKEDKVYSIIPSDGSGDLDFVRGSDGTRINSLGQVENVCWNLFNDSEDFTFGTWSKVNATVTGNTTVAPNGTTTADTIVISAGGYLYVQVNYTATAGETISMSVYSKSSTAGFLVYGGATIAGTDVEVIENVGNGWYRHIITRTFTTSGTGLVQFVGGYSSGTFQIWGAQLNKGAIKPYFKTTDRLNVPRLTYENGCPSLLLEKQSTNLITYSEDFSNADWSKEDINITTNSVISPDGTQNADKLVPNTNNTDHTVYQLKSAFSGANVSFSVYAKAAGYDYIFLGSNNNVASDGAFFNLTNGTISQNTSSLSASIQSVGNGWYRCTVSSSSYPTVYAIICASQNGTSLIFSGDNTKGIYTWGAQGEISTYPTSYIPTTSTSVTRLADSCSKTSISSLIGTEFTLFLDAYETTGGAFSRYLVLKGGGGTYANFISIECNPTNLVAVNVNNAASSSVFGATWGALTNGQRFKLALRCKNNDFAFYINGVQIATQSSGTVPTTSDLYLGYYVDYTDNYNKVNQFILFNRGLTDTELAQLTTL